MDNPPPATSGMADQPIADRAKPLVPDYELFQRIGSGAYGEVWLARNLATGARRAVKIVYRFTFADERPFNREFEGIKKFDAVSRSQPSQLALFHVGRNDAGGYFYYVMELADSIPAGADERSLSSKSKVQNSTSELEAEPHGVSYIAHTLRADLEHGHIPAARVLEIALALTEALAHLHANALIHRDVKPSNIIFVNGRPKLADIGLVTDASDSRSIVGTEGYLPREGPGTPAADIYALGKVLYEALTGLDRRQYPELPSELRQWPDARLAFELNVVLIKACSADATQRYANAEAMLAELKLLEAGNSVKRRRTVKRAWAWIWRAAAALILVAVVFLLIQNEREKRTTSTRLNATPFEKSGTTNPAAWQALERAVQMGNDYNAVGMSNAIQETERALSLDPNYTGAWVRLSSYLLLSARRRVYSGERNHRAGQGLRRESSEAEPVGRWR